MTRFSKTRCFPSKSLPFTTSVSKTQRNLSQTSRFARLSTLHSTDRKSSTRSSMADTFLQPASFLHPCQTIPSKTDAYPYDPVKAKQLLEEAVKEGTKIPDKIVLAFNNGNAVHKSVCELIQNQLKANLGLNVELTSAEWGTYIKDVDNGQYPMYRLGWIADYPDPDNFLWVLLDSANAGPKGWRRILQQPRV